MTFFYQFIYSILFLAITPLLLVRLFFKHPDYRKRWWERLGIVSSINTKKPLIWIHAVSVGEVKLTHQLINEIDIQNPNKYSFLVTTTTPSGAAQLRRQFSAEIHHRYFPYDVSVFLRLFIKQIQPSVLLVVETELWPNLFSICNKKSIPVLLINGRMSEHSYNKYVKFGIKKLALFENLNLICAQTNADAERFRLLGMQGEKIFSVGNIKFDALEQTTNTDDVIDDLGEMISDRPVWIAASTHTGEDELVVNAHKRLLTIMPSAFLILAPRHPDRCKQIKKILDDEMISYVTRSSGKLPLVNDQILLLDTLGELSAIYKLAHLGFIGGSLVEHGGQNPIEAIEKNVPIIVGNHTRNFQSIYAHLLELEAAVKVISPESLENAVLELMGNLQMRNAMSEKAQRYLQENKGSIKKLVKLISPVFTG